MACLADEIRVPLEGTTRTTTCSPPSVIRDPPRRPRRHPSLIGIRCRPGPGALRTPVPDIPTPPPKRRARVRGGILSPTRPTLHSHIERRNRRSRCTRRMSHAVSPPRQSGRGVPSGGSLRHRGIGRAAGQGHAAGRSGGHADAGRGVTYRPPGLGAPREELLRPSDQCPEPAPQRLRVAGAGEPRLRYRTCVGLCGVPCSVGDRAAPSGRRSPRIPAVGASGREVGRDAGHVHRQSAADRSSGGYRGAAAHPHGLRCLTPTADSAASS